jgi:signal transduction histidine kinase
LVPLSDVLDSTLAGIDVPEGITVINEYSDELIDIHVDSGQLQRVFANLIINAY